MTFFFINQNLHDNNIIQLKRGNCFDQWCSYYLLQLQQVLESENRTPKNNRNELKQISQESCERNPSRSPGALEDRVRHGKICEPGGGKRNNNSVRGITNHHHHKKGLGDPYSVRGLNVEFHITSDKCTLVCTVCHWLRWKTRTLWKVLSSCASTPKHIHWLANHHSVNLSWQSTVWEPAKGTIFVLVLEVKFFVAWKHWQIWSFLHCFKIVDRMTLEPFAVHHSNCLIQKWVERLGLCIVHCASLQSVTQKDLKIKVLLLNCTCWMLAHCTLLFPLFPQNQVVCLHFESFSGWSHTEGKSQIGMDDDWFEVNQNEKNLKKCLWEIIVN